MRRVGTYSCLVNYLRECVSVCMYVRVSLCAFASVYEMKLFIDSNMKGCLHDELWYFVPIVYNFREAGYP